jgi:hypothetical protein
MLSSSVLLKDAPNIKKKRIDYKLFCIASATYFLDIVAGLKNISIDIHLIS